MMLLPRSVSLIRLFSGRCRGRCLATEAAAASEVRVRFAPSPTGQLHLGGLRTAFYNYLFAKAHAGSFVLRIEDTDRTRFVPGAAENLEAMLNWIGLSPDESPTVGGPHGPYRQSERLRLYSESANLLLESGHAYKCFCSERRLDLLKKEAARLRMPNRYDGRCRTLTQQEVDDRVGRGEAFTVRFKLRPFQEPFDDLVFGHTVHDVHALEGDPIIMKSDGFPTYHLANVVDDHFMRISHVLRGVEWQVSTPKHLMMFEALGWQPPKYAHLPLINNSDGTKLSKRQNDVHIAEYKASGYFPEAVLNFITLVGGGFEDREHRLDILYSMSDLIAKFNLSRISTHSCKIEPDRLKELNRVALKEKLSDPVSVKNLADQLRKTLQSHKLDDNHSEDYLLKVLNFSADRIYTLNDLCGDDFRYLWAVPKKALRQTKPLGRATLEDIVGLLGSRASGRDSHVAAGDGEEASKMLRSYAKEKNVALPKLLKFVRAALTGSEEGPPIGEVIELLGNDVTVRRLENAGKRIKS